MDLVSIVVAVYNADKTIRKCVDSLLKQSYGNIEIILVNDYSKDSSKDICRDYEKNNKNVVVVNNKENYGVSKTRNNGIKKATGQYICFVDSDDYVEPNYIEQLYNALVDNNVKLSICGSLFHDYVNNEEIYYLWDDSKACKVISMADGFTMYSKLYLNALWNKLFITKYIKENNMKFDESLKIGEDFAFSLDYIENANVSKVAILSLPLYNYVRYSNDTLMSTFYSKNLNLEMAISRYVRLKNIVSQYNKNAEELYSLAVSRLVDTYKYNIVRGKMSVNEKIKCIKKYIPNYNYFSYLLDCKSKYKEIIFKKVQKEK